jgi:hypothetical protein
MLRSGRRLVGLAAMWTSQTPPPHSVDQSECYVAHQENGERDNGGVAIDDEDEVVYIDHLLGVPRACVSVLRRAFGADLRFHM